ncbi:Uncharacterised protein [Mycobacterium tuberculosis]|nr:Uncharacterised protein [Mycobacterium tuberculosis]CFR69847.1 Uncharacterised protein [Mycobacterium tuberculosis]CFS38998.1 Uncharacterised protein [Mycobacterium tuberculosis]CKM93536.1 Uncharacterised protein [Mycobacterium tuberculosis]CKM95579.1 Uncharacterised protein [Mycobacterium tuberculosis]
MGALRSQIQRTTPEPLAEAHPQAFDPAPVVGMGACRRNQRMVIVASGARPARAHAVRCRWLFSSGNSFPQAEFSGMGSPRSGSSRSPALLAAHMYPVLTF